MVGWAHSRHGYFWHIQRAVPTSPTYLQERGDRLEPRIASSYFHFEGTPGVQSCMHISIERIRTTVMTFGVHRACSWRGSQNVGSLWEAMLETLSAVNGLTRVMGASFGNDGRNSKCCDTDIFVPDVKFGWLICIRFQEETLLAIWGAYNDFDEVCSFPPATPSIFGARDIILVSSCGTSYFSLVC
jgi:hypothetical protein